MGYENKTAVVTGASRGIGFAIACKLALSGVRVVIVAKTVEPHPKLAGTIYSAAREIEEQGGRALPIKADIRYEEQVVEAVSTAVKHYGGIDILVNNASAIQLSSTVDTDMKRYDLMHGVNARGTFLMSKYCLPHLLKSANPHILNISPPLSMQPRWFAPHTAYTASKYGMSMCTLGMAEEFKGRVAVNSLWPQTTIATAAIANVVGGNEAMARSRKPSIMADAAWYILAREVSSEASGGNFYIDEAVLGAEGVTNLKSYQVNPGLSYSDLQQDFFI